jgi:hypothetical protein
MFLCRTEAANGLSLLLLLCKDPASLEQVQDNTQRNQTDEPVLTQVRNQGGEIIHDSVKERDFFAKENAGDNRQGDQQQEDFRNLTKPLLYFFQVMHLRLS